MIMYSLVVQNLVVDCVRVCAGVFISGPCIHGINKALWRESFGCLAEGEKRYSIMGAKLDDCSWL
jgi:hypothetical protein